MRTIKFAVECMLGIACAIFFDAVFIICTQMNVIISDQNIVYMILQLVLLFLAVIWISMLWFRKLGAGKREVLYRAIIMIIYTVNLLSLGETLYHTRIWHILQATKNNHILKNFIILYVLFCLAMWAIQIVKMLNALNVDRIIEKSLERLLGEIKKL